MREVTLMRDYDNTEVKNPPELNAKCCKVLEEQWHMCRRLNQTAEAEAQK